MIHPKVTQGCLLDDNKTNVRKCVLLCALQYLHMLNHMDFIKYNKKHKFTIIHSYILYSPLLIIAGKENLFKKSFLHLKQLSNF